jgi:hypothetical protein
MPCLTGCSPDEIRSLAFGVVGTFQGAAGVSISYRLSSDVSPRLGFAIFTL